MNVCMYVHMYVYARVTGLGNRTDDARTRTCDRNNCEQLDLSQHRVLLLLLAHRCRQVCVITVDTLKQCVSAFPPKLSELNGNNGYNAIGILYYIL